MKIIILCLLGLVGCSTQISAPATVPAKVAEPTAAELREKAEEENDRATAISYVEEINKQIQANIELPPTARVEQKVEELIFADHRKVAIVVLRVTLLVQNISVREAFLTFVIARTSPNTWDIKTAFSRTGESEEDQNGTKL